MIEPRTIHLEPEAVMAMSQILGIMLDQMFDAETSTMWNTEHIIELEARLVAPAEGEPVEMGIDDASLLLQGMAFTEVMSAELPWIDMVRWVTDFVTTELRQHWTEEEWQTFFPTMTKGPVCHFRNKPNLLFDVFNSQVQDLGEN